MRTTLDLPTPMLRDIKVQAAQAGVSMKTLLTQWIEAALRNPTSTSIDTHVTKTVTMRPLPSFVRPPRANAPMQAALSNAQLSALLDEADAKHLANVGTKHSTKRAS
jgi:hypothetical protein